MMVDHEQAPLVSVVMPVYNSENYVGLAIESILAQTQPNFELIIIDDCSEDHSVKVIEQYRDPRISLIKNAENLGVVKALNKGIAETTGQFIARMDSDDIAESHRLEAQLNFLQSQPDFALVGSNANLIDEKGQTIGRFTVANKHEDIKFAMLFKNQFIHPSIMFRKSLVTTKDFYKEQFPFAEDYHLWTEIILKHKCFNLPDALLNYRIHKQSISVTASLKQQQSANAIRKHYLTTAGLTDLELIKKDIENAVDLTVDEVNKTEQLFNGIFLRISYKSAFLSKLYVHFLIRSFISGHRVFFKYLTSNAPCKRWAWLVLIALLPILVRLPKCLFKNRLRILTNRE